MSPEHFLGAIAAYLGSLTAGFFVNRRLRDFLRGHLDGIYRRIGRIEQRIDVTPSPFPSTDPGPEPFSGVHAILSGGKRE